MRAAANVFYRCIVQLRCRTAGNNPQATQPTEDHRRLPVAPPRVKHTVPFGQKLVGPLRGSRLYQINRVFLAPENRANLFRVPVPDWKNFPPSGGRTLVPEICDRGRRWRKKRPSDFIRAELVSGIDRNPLRFWFILPLE